MLSFVNTGENRKQKQISKGIFKKVLCRQLGKYVYLRRREEKTQRKRKESRGQQMETGENRREHAHK